MVHVLLAEDQPRVRRALRALLELEPRVQSVREAVEAEALLAQMETATPDLVFLDWELPGLVKGMAKRLRRRYPNVVWVALSAMPDADLAALAAGMDVFISKTDPPDRLLSGVLPKLAN